MKKNLLNNRFKKIKGEIYTINPKGKFIILQTLEFLIKFENMLFYEKVLGTNTKLLKSKNNH